MDKVLEKYKLPKLTQEAIESLERPIRSNEIEFIIPITKKIPNPDSFTGGFYQRFKELTVIKFFQNIE